MHTHTVAGVYVCAHVFFSPKLFLWFCFSSSFFCVFVRARPSVCLWASLCVSVWTNADAFKLTVIACVCLGCSCFILIDFPFHSFSIFVCLIWRWVLHAIYWVRVVHSTNACFISFSSFCSVPFLCSIQLLLYVYTFSTLLVVPHFD